jgi:ribonuclease HII
VSTDVEEHIPCESPGMRRECLHVKVLHFKTMKKPKLLVGVDEAGRGPLAGPVAVGAIVYDPEDRILRHSLRKLMPEVRDSKQLTEKHREAIYEELVVLAKITSLELHVALVAASVVDTRGITYAVKKGIERVLKRVPPKHSRVLLDGGLKAPAVFVNQETHIRGDATHLPIALASIAAKVRRDRHMRMLAKRFPNYGFEIHKGYGTKNHYKALKKHGPSAIHRHTYIDATKTLRRIA